MARSDYEYSIQALDGHDFIIIKDLNQGRMSVTNNIQEVLSEIEKIEEIDAFDYLVIYRDSENIYDGYDVKTNSFVFLGVHTIPLATKKYLEKINKYEKVDME